MKKLGVKLILIYSIENQNHFHFVLSLNDTFHNSCKILKKLEKGLSNDL